MNIISLNIKEMILTQEFDLRDEYDIKYAYDYISNSNKKELVVLIIGEWCEKGCNECTHKRFTISENDQKIMINKAIETGKILYWKRGCTLSDYAYTIDFLAEYIVENMN